MTPPARATGTAVYVVVVAVAVAGLVLVALDHWRGGVGLVGGAMLVAGALRLVVPERQAGWLRIRHRWGDSATMLALGLLLVALAVIVPPQPPGR